MTPPTIGPIFDFGAGGGGAGEGVGFDATGTMGVVEEAEVVAFAELIASRKSIFQRT
jgi:hypothetical protein